jgi:hypothetical protein
MGEIPQGAAFNPSGWTAEGLRLGSDVEPYPLDNQLQ